MKERLREELQKYLVVSGYLFICFGALLVYKTASLSGSGAPTVSLGLALGKALILGKFLLIGDAARIGARGRTRNILHRILRRSVLLLFFLVLLTIVEEFLVGRVHGQSAAQMFAEFNQRSLQQVLANSVLLLLVLIPLVAVAEIKRALGPGVLRRLLFDATPGEQGSPRPGNAGE